jgi:hypothetical protein
VHRLPKELARFWPPATFSATELPTSYSFVAAVFRLIEGDVGVRPDVGRALRPHYECTLEGGWRLTTQDWATSSHCAASLQLGSAGFVSASASYGWGLLAVSHSSSTRFSLAYNLLL